MEYRGIASYVISLMMKNYDAIFYHSIMHLHAM